MPDTLVQPIQSAEPDPGYKKQDVLTLAQFLELLREEEDYWPGDQQNTKLMITRLRKVFYDKWGWDSLIRAASEVEARYDVEIYDTPTEKGQEESFYIQYEYTPKYREAIYLDNDKVYGSSRAGQVPDIYANNHQEVLLPDGTYCDMAHILAGMDAFNYPQVVSPLQGFLSFLDRIFPHVNSNMDTVTWLGDIASSSGDFLFAWLLNGKVPLTEEEEQNYINIDAPGSDMLGDIDAYVIPYFYDITTDKGQRVTDILSDYYTGDNNGSPYRNRRFSVFCEAIGLGKLKGDTFENEKRRLKYYKRELRNNVAIQVFSLTNERLLSLYLPLRIWLNGYKDVVKLEYLLDIFLSSLKDSVKQELNLNTK